MKKTLLIGALLVGLGLTTTLNATYYCGNWISKSIKFVRCTPFGCGEDGKTYTEIDVYYIKRCVDINSNVWEENKTSREYGSCSCTY